MTEQEEDEYYAQVIKVINDIRGLVGNTRGTSGEIACPRCGQKIKYQTSKFNGHLSGSCQTEKCIRWVQ